jgi:hypothetical protein
LKRQTEPSPLDTTLAEQRLEHALDRGGWND